jgi:beta-lactamase regulating signal transducer with metallopeptidase domain
MSELANPGLAVPIGVFVMVVLIVAINCIKTMRTRELQAHQELRMREMEHERKMKELEIEKAKIELEKARLPKPAGSVPQ